MIPAFLTGSTSSTSSTLPSTSTPEKNSDLNDNFISPKPVKRGSAPAMSSGKKLKTSVFKLPFPYREAMANEPVSPSSSARQITVTPRKNESKSSGSPRVLEDERPPSSRQHIEKKYGFASDTSSIASLQKRDPSSRSSAPPKMIAALGATQTNLKLTTLSAEFSKAWIKAAREAAGKSGKAILTEAIIQSISRSECRFLKSELSPDLLAMLPANSEKNTVTHADVLKALFGHALRNSGAGKTLLTMKRVVMEENPAYAQIKIGSIPDNDFKETAIEGMKQQAKAGVDVAFGIGERSLAASKLPVALIDCWKMMDRELVEWAKENPLLSDEKILVARSNLGIDTIITRMIYPLIYGDSLESHLLVPGWYANAVRLQLIAAWPEFFADFVKQMEAESSLS